MTEDKKKIFPVTLPAIKRYGIENWLEDFCMPVHAGEYQRIYRNFLEAYVRSMPSENDNSELYWVCCACYKVTMNISYYYFRKMLYLGIVKEGFTHLGEDFDLPVNEKKLSIDLDDVEYAGFFFRGREYWRKIRTNWGHRGVLESLFTGDLTACPLYIVGNRFQSMVASYIEHRRIEPICLRPNLYIKEKYRLISERMIERISEFVKGTFTIFKKEFPDSDMIFDEAVFRFFTDYLIERSKDFKSINTILSKKKCTSELLIYPIGNLSLRLFAAVWRSEGGEVTGFTHGNAYTECNPADVLNGAHSVLSKYIASSGGDKKLQEFARESVSHSLVSQAGIESCEDSTYLKTFQKLKQSKSGEKTDVKKVMLVGFPMDYMYYYGWPSLNTLTYCHFEINIIKALKNAGFYVIYKAHPDSLLATQEIHRHYADEFLTENFSEVYNKADALLFTYPSTTTFGFSLMTNIPMVVFCENIDKWHPDLLELLKKRCVILPMGMDSRSRVEFDRNQLVEAIKHSPEHLNHDVVREFALK